VEGGVLRGSMTMSFKQGRGDRKSSDAGLKQKKSDKTRKKMIFNLVSRYLTKNEKDNFIKLLERCDSLQKERVAQQVYPNISQDTTIKILAKLKKEGWELMFITAQGMTFRMKSKSIRLDFFPLNRENHIQYTVGVKTLSRLPPGAVITNTKYMFDAHDYLESCTKLLMLEHLI
jgi:hypothetical protein